MRETVDQGVCWCPEKTAIFFGRTSLIPAIRAARGVSRDIFKLNCVDSRRKHEQLRLLPQRKCPTHIRLKAYLLKCLSTTQKPWIKLRFDIVAKCFGVTDRTMRRAKRRLENDPELKFRTLSKGKGSGWQVIVGLEAKLLWDKEPLFYKRWREGFRSRNVRNRHCGYSVEEQMSLSSRVNQLLPRPVDRSLASETNSLSEPDDAHEPHRHTDQPRSFDYKSGRRSASIHNRSSLPDTYYKRKNSYGITAVKTDNQRTRRWLLASSSKALRRRASSNQYRLAWFSARSAWTWHRWENLKVSENSSTLKGLWLAGLVAGFDLKTIEKAFVKALKHTHGLATDVGLNEGHYGLHFEMSCVVSYGKKLLENSIADKA